MVAVRTQICCLFLMSFIGIIYFSAVRVKNRLRWVFCWLYFTVSFNLCFDIITVYMIYHLDKVNPLLNRVCHDFFLGSILTALFLCYQYVCCLIKNEKKQKIVQSGWGCVPYILSWPVLLFGTLHYKNTPKGNYSYGTAAMVCYICAGIYLLLAFAKVIKYWNDIDRRKRMTIGMALLIEMFGGVYQFFRPVALISGFALTFIVIAVFLTMESPDAQLVERLEAEMERADRANRAKTNFLAGMSHEIRTPINVILGMDELILREYADEKLREYALNIRRSANFLLGTINDILDLSKIESGKMELIQTEYETGKLLGDLISIASFPSEKKGLLFETEINHEIPCRLAGDEIRLKQIVSNLLTNGVKYTEKGTLKLQVNFRKAGENSIFLIFTVTDTGIGIKKENLKKLFESFTRLDEIKNRSVEGSGLGLSITKRLVQLMNGNLTVDSIYGEGSTFTVEIEQKVTDWSAMGDPALYLMEEGKKEQYTCLFKAPKAKVLVVDDNEMNCAVTAGLLKATKVQVATVASGAKCLEYLSKGSYDVILMDHMMPDMDGIETLSKIREMDVNRCKEVPVIMMTANVLNGTREQYLTAGFQDFLAKPVEGKKLEKMLLKYLPSSLIEEGVSEERLIPDRVIIKAEESGLIDLDEGREKAGGTALFQDLLAIFSEGFEKKNRKITEYEKAGELENFTIAVHSLKSSAALIGADRLSKMAADMEQSGKNGNLEKIHRDTHLLLQLYRETVLEARSIISQGNISN